MSMFTDSDAGLIKFTAVIEDDVIIFNVSGEMVMETLSRCDSALSLVVSQGYRKLLLSLTGVKQVDQHGALFLRGMSNLKEEYGILVKIVSAPATEVDSILRSYHVQDYVSFYPSADAALYNFSREGMADLTRPVDDSSRGLKFRTGQVLEVTLDRGPWCSVHFCVLEQVHDQHLAITWPWGEGEDGLAMLKQGWRIQTNFLTINGIFSFSSTVSQLQIKPDPLIFITKPSAVFHLKRRGYPRIGLGLPISCRVFKGSFTLDDAKLDACCVNLSGSGALLLFKKQVEANDSLILSFRLLEEELHEVVGRIVRVDIIHTDNETRWQAGIKFSAIFDIDRGKISRYVLDEIFSDTAVPSTQ
ncbi:MAG: PilZ domain-containing protein [bacterium]|nr:PilZ domain-containing protein [bacterium]